MRIPDALLLQIVPELSGCLLHLLHGISVGQFLDDDHVIFVHFRDKVLAAAIKICPDHIQHIAVPSAGGLRDQNRPRHIRLNMQPLGTAVDIHQKQIIQKQVLDEIILIQAFPVSHQKILYLERRNLADGIHILACGAGHKHIRQLLIVKYLKKLIPLYLLGIRRRSRKFRNRSADAVHVSGGSNFLSVHVHNTKFDACNIFQPVNRVL